jgi:hypothetical protein
MRQRMGRPGLLGTMARTAVISGTATAVSGNVARRQQARAATPAPEPPPPPPPPAPAPAQPAQPARTGGSEGADLMTQLQKLADMRTAGLLTDAEFTAAKGRLLG